MTPGHHSSIAYLVSGLFHAAILCAALRVPVPRSAPGVALPSGRASIDSVARPASLAARWTAADDAEQAALHFLKIPAVLDAELPSAQPVRSRRRVTAEPTTRVPEWTVTVPPPERAARAGWSETGAMSQPASSRLAAVSPLQPPGRSGGASGPVSGNRGVAAGAERNRGDTTWVARRFAREAAAIVSELLQTAAAASAERRPPAAECVRAESPVRHVPAVSPGPVAQPDGEKESAPAPPAAGRLPWETGDASPPADARPVVEANDAGGQSSPARNFDDIQRSRAQNEADRPSAAASNRARPAPRQSRSAGNPADSAAARDSRRQRGAVFDTPPRAVPSNAPPTYPAESIAAGEQGRTVLKVAIDASGRVHSVAVYRSSGYARLDAAALEAVRRWRFTPARRDRRPVSCEVLVPVRFQIRPSASAD